MLPCARRACAPLPPLSAGDILRACAPASILRSESIILLLRASDVNLRACTNLPKARIPSTITRWPERSGRRKCGRGQHDREHSKHSHFHFWKKLTKLKVQYNSEGGWEEDKKRPRGERRSRCLVLRSAACTADRRFNDRLPRLFSYCLPP